MADGRSTYSTLLYPGVILQGDKIIISPATSIPQLKTKSRTNTIRKVDAKSERKRNKKFVNVLIEE